MFRLLILVLTLAAVGAAGAAPADTPLPSKGPPPGRVQFDYTRSQNAATLARGLAVDPASSPGDVANANIETVASLPVPSPTAGELLRVGYVAKFSKCILGDINGLSDRGSKTPCHEMRNHPNYDDCCGAPRHVAPYDPSIATRVALWDVSADSAHRVAESAWNPLPAAPGHPSGECSQRHHCAIPGHIDGLPVPTGLPNDRFALRLEAVAYDQSTVHPYRHDLVEVDADCEHGNLLRCPASRQLNRKARSESSVGDQLSVLRPGATRILPTAPYSAPTDGVFTRHITAHESKVKPGRVGNLPAGRTHKQRVVVASASLGSAQPGDLIDVADAQFTAHDHSGDGYAFEHLVQSSLILTNGPRVASGNRVLYNLSPWAGGNCNPSPPKTHCGDPSSVTTFHSTGMAKIPSDAKGPLYLNLVARANDKQAPDGTRVDFGPASIDLLCSSPADSSPSC